MARLTPTEAVALLATQQLVVLENESGIALNLTPLSATGTRLVGSAERLKLTEEGELIARIRGEDDRPWLVGFEVESAAYHSAALAHVTLRARSVRLDPHHRRSQRTALGGRARLVAINCQDVVDGDVVEGTIRDVSDSGVAFTTQRVLRVGDRLMFAGHFFASTVEAEVRVAQVRDGKIPGESMVGCRFIEIAAAERRKLVELTAERPRGERHSFGALQRLAAAEDSGDESPARPAFWRRPFRRSA